MDLNLFFTHSPLYCICTHNTTLRWRFFTSNEWMTFDFWMHLRTLEFGFSISPFLQWQPRHSNPPPRESPSELPPPTTPPPPPPSFTAAPGASAVPPALPSPPATTKTAAIAALREAGSSTPSAAPASRRSASTISPSSSSSPRSATASAPEPPSQRPVLPAPAPPRRSGEGGPYRGRAPVSATIEEAVLAGEGRSLMRIREGGDRYRWFGTKLAILRYSDDRLWFALVFRFEFDFNIWL